MTPERSIGENQSGHRSQPEAASPTTKMDASLKRKRAEEEDAEAVVSADAAWCEALRARISASFAATDASRRAQIGELCLVLPDVLAPRTCAALLPRALAHHRPQTLVYTKEYADSYEDSWRISTWGLTVAGTYPHE